MRISDIQRQKRNTHRASIYIDGKYAFSLDYDTLLESGLHLGDEVPDELRERLIGKDELARARDYAYTLLSYRERTEHELGARLREKGFTPGSVERVGALLKEKGLLDDRVFALKWIDDMLASKPMGRVRVEHELKRRRIRDELIDEACDLKLGAGAEMELARSACRKRLESLASYPREVAARRLERFLRGRGFDFGVIRALMREYFGGEGESGGNSEEFG